jgi:hypothetical protein
MLSLHLSVERTEKGPVLLVQEVRLAKLFRLLLLEKTRTGAYREHFVSFIACRGHKELVLESSI